MEWSKEQITNLVRQEIQTRDAHSRFQLVPLQRHVHNNLDSPLVFQPILTYVGLLGVGSAVNPVTINMLPNGWDVVYQSTGAYSVFHNLGTVLYSVTAVAAQSTNQKVVCVSEGFNNQVDFNWFLASGLGPATDTGFFFTLTVISNKSQIVPTYYGTYITAPPQG